MRSPGWHEPFPRERLAALIGRLPRYARLAWRLGRDPALSRLRRAAVLGAAAYVVSPIDLLPGIIPGIGQIDDVAVALAALRLALSGLDPQRRRAHLAAVGLVDEDLMEDARTVGLTAAWLVRTGGRTAFRVAERVARVGSSRLRGALPAAGRLLASVPADPASRDRPATLRSPSIPDSG